jgi:hypothetical protein
MNSYCFIQCSYLFIPEKINKSFIVFCIALNNDQLAQRKTFQLQTFQHMALRLLYSHECVINTLVLVMLSLLYQWYLHVSRTAHSCFCFFKIQILRLLIVLLAIRILSRREENFADTLILIQ